MPPFVLETLRQNALHKSLGTIKEDAPHAPAMQADFRASGDRLLDMDQKHKSLDLIRKNGVNFILQVPHRKELEEEPLECQEKGAEVNTRTAKLYSA